MLFMYVIGNISLLMTVNSHLVVVQLLSCVWLSVTPRTAERRLPFPSPFPRACSNSCASSQWCHPNVILYHPLLLPSIFPNMRVFSNELTPQIRWPKYWSFSFRVSPSNEYSGLISFRIDWFDLLAVQETPKSLLRYQSSKASILLCWAFFIVQLSHPYVTTGKTIALTR